ncbi:MAG TPA: protein kinase [Kofleriaceae bacterium]|nr:protein kinase [Kofleriaceae bacterium]
MNIEVGDEIGPYRVVGQLPGDAYRAVHVASPRRVIITLGSATDWRASAIDMLRTARMIEALGHPGIAPIVDRGVLADRRPWVAVEVPSGVALYDVIARRAMPPEEVAALVHDLADVLAHAHEHGLVHRALTLRAIVMSTGARAFSLCITDWGVRRADLGVYAAPEGQHGDGRVDIYALGVIAYRVLTGRFPTDARVAEVSGATPGVAALIASMLSPEPTARPTALEVRALARELAAGVAIVADLAEASRQAEGAVPELVTFGDDTPRAGDDQAYAPIGPRFTKPKWTPPPPLRPITSDVLTTASGEIDPTKPRS